MGEALHFSHDPPNRAASWGVFITAGCGEAGENAPFVDALHGIPAGPGFEGVTVIEVNLLGSETVTLSRIPSPEGTTVYTPLAAVRFSAANPTIRDQSLTPRPVALVLTVGLPVCASLDEARDDTADVFGIVVDASLKETTRTFLENNLEHLRTGPLRTILGLAERNGSQRQEKESKKDGP